MPFPMPIAQIEAIQLIEFLFMLVIDMMFLVALVLLMLPLGMWRQAAFAVMKRNFIGYFSNPTGYVFLCLFVLLTSFAAFWPHEFFTTNLANFDQLNKFLPYIMLIFIPAITMSIWAEERRQGTDELLLTLPAKDFDIVIGKYFAAVLVFTVSLLFSQLSNYAVLLAMTGGQLDNLLLFSTYLGYWFMGIAMISLGMVASFLTSNLTVGFIFGAALNAPLAFFSNADVIFSNSGWIQNLFDWSLLQRFEPFGRGLISASSICYFAGIVVIGVYLSLILIGRRHWLGGRDGTSLLWHYLLRAVFLGIIAVGVVLIVQHSPLNRARVDISDSQISTLATSTTDVLDRLALETEERPIKIEAYISNNVPSEYVKLKYDLVNLLREFDVRGGNRVQVSLHQGIEPFSEEAILAEKKYGIRPRRVRSQSRGAVREEEVILGVAFSSGLERIVIPFMPYGMPVEYELMRSINTVAKSQRKTIGIVQTDALVMGANINGGERGNFRLPRFRIIADLEKQYNVEEVDASSPISLWIEGEPGEPLRRRYDALLVMQPSHSTESELKNLITAIQSGQPTAIFEDPFPTPMNFRVQSGQQGQQGKTWDRILPTYFPRSMARRGSQAANIQELFDALELNMDRRNAAAPGQPPAYSAYVLWQPASANPYKRSNQLNLPESVIISQIDKREPRFDPEHEATKDVSEIYLQYAGYLAPAPIPNPRLEFRPLVSTSAQTGKIGVQELFRGQANPQQLEIARGAADQQFIVAAEITGKQKDSPLPQDVESVKPSIDKTNVIYVADMDILSDFFVNKRDFPIENGIEYRYQNMSLVLNIIDSLAGEKTYLGIRNRKVDHVTLEEIEKTYEVSMTRVFDLDQELQKEYATSINVAQASMDKKLDDLKSRIQKIQKSKEAGETYDANKLSALLGLFESTYRDEIAKFQNKKLSLENERKEAKRRIDLEAELEIQKIQRKFKLAAVIIPPIPPLLVGLIVFTRRRLREREGISKDRRLK